MNAWEGMNRRKFPRVTYPCMVILRHAESGDDVILSHTENLGTGGIGVILKSHIKMFSPVGVELDLLDLEDNVHCQGRVVWTVKRTSLESAKPLYYDVGIEFVDLKDEARARISTIVERLAQRQRPLTL